jgi:hypothetical protein
MRNFICIKALFIGFLLFTPYFLFSQNIIQSFAEYAFDDFSLKNGEITNVNANGVEISFEAGKNTISFEVEDSVSENLSDYRSAIFDIANTGSNKCRVNIWLVERSWISSSVILSPGETKSLQVDLSRRSQNKEEYFPKMNGVPGGTLSRGLGLNAIKKIKVEIFAEGSGVIKLSNLKGYYPYISPSDVTGTPDFYPFIDKFGQYIHEEWPGKIHSANEMEASYVTEMDELQLIDSPKNFNKYGGWETGPTSNATGHFRVEKVDGKWWFIDPTGKLFWSHGPTCVRFSNAVTQINSREKFFQNLPAENSEYNFCYSESRGIKTFNFTESNLIRKFGEDWKEKSTELLYKRFRSWGMNTYANWSDPSIFLDDQYKVPYTATISSGGPRLDHNNKKFPDPFDPDFLISLSENAKEVTSQTKDDPYCIGYFVDNELSVWNLADAAFKQDENGYAKQEFIEMLRLKYGDIENLNDKWLTNFKNWREFSLTDELPESSAVDASVFEKHLIDKYYKECAIAVKKYAPQKLYMGSRLHCHYYPDDKREEYIIKIAAEYCDIISFNRYRFIAEDLILPTGVDKPIIIGEFHFGALDRGYFHTGLRGVANQQQRAEAYISYMEGALRNDFLVGAHWFQYGAQAFTGRFDGENYQIGIVDICDNPYPEFINAIRNIGYKMYPFRMTN